MLTHRSHKPTHAIACLHTQEVEAALQGSQDTATKQLKALHGRCMIQLEDLVELIRGPLSDLERKVRVLQHSCV